MLYFLHAFHINYNISFLVFFGGGQWKLSIDIQILVFPRSFSKFVFFDQFSITLYVIS